MYLWRPCFLRPLFSCNNLGGRLPAISELRTLIQNCPATETGGECGVTDDCLLQDDCRNDSCYGCEYDNSGKYSVFGDIDLFWSSSEQSDSIYGAWRVDFYFSHMSYNGKNGLTYVRCVK